MEQITIKQEHGPDLDNDGEKIAFFSSRVVLKVGLMFNEI